MIVYSGGGERLGAGSGDKMKYADMYVCSPDADQGC